MRRFNFTSLIAAVVLLGSVACTKPTKGPDDSGGGSFKINKLSATGNPNSTEGKVWQVTEQVTYTVHACVIGTLTTEKIIGQRFNVEVPGTTQLYPVKTDSDGCFNWDEPFDFNHFVSKSAWVAVERDVVGSGSYTGKQRIRFAVNPWACESIVCKGAFVSLLEGERELPKSVKLFSAAEADDVFQGKTQGLSRLHAQNVKITAIPEGEGRGEDGLDFVKLRIVLELEPEVEARNSIGRTYYTKIVDGQFGLNIQMLGANVGVAQDKTMVLLSGDTYAVARAKSGVITAEFLVRQTVRPNQSNLELVLNMRPINLKNEPAPFNAVYRFGAGTTIKDHKGVLKNECEDTPDKCDFNTVIKQAANYNDLKKDDELKKYATPNSRYVFSNLKLRFIQIMPGETTTRRTVMYEATTCITDNQTGESLANTPFVIHYKKDEKGADYDAEIEWLEKKTDESGCLSWNGRVFHKYYEPEKYFEKNVEIMKGAVPITKVTMETVNKGTPEERTFERTTVLGISGTPTFNRALKFYLNPWDDKFTFGWDAREFGPDFFLDIKNRPKIPSRFFVSEYNYHTVRFLYNIDQFMELDVKKWVLMGVVPQVLRYSGIINARKMVEHLRDGIYLMKVGIQKDYLDPRDNSGWLLKNNPEMQATMERINGAELAPKEYISTNTVLVRIVDGVIVYPVELTMRDLRLMRVRANLMIQLEMVDERMIQAYHVFKKANVSSTNLLKELEKFKKDMPQGLTSDDMSKDLAKSSIAPALKDAIRKRQEMAKSPDMLKARQELQDRVQRVQGGVEALLRKLKRQYETGGTGLLQEIDSEGKPIANLNLEKDSINLAPMQLTEAKTKELNDDLAKVLDINDFSTVPLPKKEEIDLNIFAEEDSGLEKRSFVGPVIFLSNAYSDSMRATDNLDEAGCVPKNTDGVLGRDIVRATLEELEIDQHYVDTYQKVETKMDNKRQNNAYKFSKYFNSLNHLCYKNVDDLIKDEKKLNDQNLLRSQAASLKYNFIKNFELDFVSLTNEPLEKVRTNCVVNTDPTKGPIENCLQVTGEDTLKAGELNSLINDRLEKGVTAHNTNPENIAKRFRGIPFRIEKNSWTEQEYPELFYKHSLESKAALCNMMTNRIARDLRAKKLSSISEDMIHEKLMDICVRDGGLIHDIKYRVEQTGKYAFLGGLNLNFNVGEGFSVGTSSGWSAGMEITDVVGVGGSVGGGLIKGAALAIKPFNVKYGTGLSSSEGTNISESTYLVSQIAGFDVELSAYERCAWIGLSPETIQRWAMTWGDSKISRAIGLGRANFEDPEVQKVVHRGLFVCEGLTRKQNKPVTVPENYFYFTQHFTEGDMLDQADLYNHPWLLSLRGMRDFSIFVEKIRAQQVVNFSSFLYHMTGTSDSRPKGWALDHLADAYRTVTPTFPGFYTVLDRGEPLIDQFALQQAAKRQGQSVLSKVDKDPLKEVNHGKLYNNESQNKSGVFGPIR